MNSFTNALGLDVGSSRIGVARVNSVARLPHALTVLKNDDQLIDNLRHICDAEAIDLIVVGLPRNMKGEKTAQSLYVEEFVFLLEKLGIKTVFQDETLSTVEAKSRTKAGQPDDAEAAAVILGDFIANDKI